MPTLNKYVWLAELADAGDLKSPTSNGLMVRVHRHTPTQLA